MFTTTLLVAALATYATGAPVTERQTENARFVMIATHSGNSAVHLRGIEANGQRFWLGKDTATYCPESSSVPCDQYSKFLSHLRFKLPHLTSHSKQHNRRSSDT